jgi:integrase
MPATQKRKVSLRVAHSRNCRNANRSAPSSTGRGSGCTCSPSWYPFYRDEQGRPVKGERIDDKELARRAATKIQNELDEERREVKGPDRRTFNEWTPEFFRILEVRQRRESTRLAYVSTVKFANRAFGGTQLRDVGQPDLRRFVSLIRDGGAGDATVSKHLKQLSAILEAAVDDGVIAANPVPRFRKGLGLKVPRGTEPFTDEELARLFVQLAKEEPVYVALVRAGLYTGLRQGELVAATWGDLDLGRGVLHVERSRDPRTGIVGPPKDGEARDVYLVPQARELFEAWLARVGMRPDDEPIFTAPRSGGYVNGLYATKVLKAAMIRADIPTVDKAGRARKPFHGLRATFTRICLESGRPAQWVQNALGHSAETLTTTVYGRWDEAAIAAEAARGAAFPDVA